MDPPLQEQMPITQFRPNVKMDKLMKALLEEICQVSPPGSAALNQSGKRERVSRGARPKYNFAPTGHGLHTELEDRPRLALRNEDGGQVRLRTPACQAVSSTADLSTKSTEHPSPCDDLPLLRGNTFAESRCLGAGSLGISVESDSAEFTSTDCTDYCGEFEPDSDLDNSFSSGKKWSLSHSNSCESDPSSDGDLVDLHTPPTQPTSPRDGFLKGSEEELLQHIRDIIDKPRDCGRFVGNIFNPVVEGCISYYREGQEYTKERPLQRSPQNEEVSLCRDNCSHSSFVIKKVRRQTYNPTGTLFMMEHCQSKDFLPKIYGIYSEKDFIRIFQEFIPGDPARHEWNPVQARQFAERLLTICCFLHQHGLAHCDIKLKNLLLRDTSDPRSLVIIDFQSSKLRDSSYPFKPGGHTITYLPPWHKDIVSLKTYDSILTTSDLWATAVAIIVSLPMELLLQPGHSIWSQKLKDLRKNCDKECKGVSACRKCRENFKQYLTDYGDQILKVHLGPQMTSPHVADPDVLVLRNLLEYLTDPRNIHEKNADTALQIVRGTRR